MEKHGNGEEENMNSAMSNREKLRCKDRGGCHRSGRRHGTGRAWLMQGALGSEA